MPHEHPSSHNLQENTTYFRAGGQRDSQISLGLPLTPTLLNCLSQLISSILNKARQPQIEKMVRGRDASSRGRQGQRRRSDCSWWRAQTSPVNNPLKLQCSKVIRTRGAGRDWETRCRTGISWVNGSASCSRQQSILTPIVFKALVASHTSPNSTHSLLKAPRPGGGAEAGRRAREG